MLRDDTKKWAVELLVPALMRVPLGSWTCIEDVIEACDGIQKTAEGRFAMPDHNASFSYEHLDTIESEALQKLEDNGLYVDTDSYKTGFCLYERIKQGSLMDYSSLKKMSYSPLTWLRSSQDVGCTFEGRTLATTGLIDGQSSVSVELNDEQFCALCHALEKAHLELWEESYWASVLDGTSWNFFVLFEGNKVFTSHGSNAWPESFVDLHKSIMRILEEGK